MTKIKLKKPAVQNTLPSSSAASSISKEPMGEKPRQKTEIYSDSEISRWNSSRQSQQCGRQSKQEHWQSVSQLPRAAACCV